MRSLTIIVLGTAASDAFAGMAWMTMQIVAGFRLLGHDAWYFEVTSTWPYDPVQRTRVQSSDYAAAYLARVCDGFGLGDRWAYRRSYADGEWLGLSGQKAEALLAGADLVFNVAGATNVQADGLVTGRLVLLGTDPVLPEIAYANGDARVRTLVDAHADVVTYGENIGTPRSPVPALPRLRAHTRQPVLMQSWRTEAAPRNVFTTIGNWKQTGLDVGFRGETYRWSKHHEFAKIMDLPQRTSQPIELATNLASDMRHGEGTVVPATGLGDDDYANVTRHGWRVVDGPALSTDPWTYRDYIVSSRGELTVARDLNVRLNSGWFSERSACYLAAGRPVITQDTGFGSVLPVGEGLFAFRETEEILAALDAVNSDYERHSNAARAIAAEYFASERVLPRLLADLGA